MEQKGTVEVRDNSRVSRKERPWQVQGWREWKGHESCLGFAKVAVQVETGTIAIESA